MKKLILIPLVFALLVGCDELKLGAGDGSGGGNNGGNKGGTVEGGVVNGGGGKGVQCGEGDQTSLEVLDIYEGHFLYDQTYNELGGLTGDALFDALMERTYEFMALPHEPFSDEDRREIEGHIRSYVDRIRFTEEGQSLRNTNDADEVVDQEGCVTVQIAVYYDESTLLVDSLLWNQLDEFNQMSLVFHEVIYQWQRLEAGAETSIGTRRLIANLFGDNGIEPLYTEELLNAPLSDIGYCFENGHGAPEIAFYVLRQPRGIKIIFDDYFGSTPLFSTTASVVGVEFDQIVMGSMDTSVGDSIRLVSTPYSESFGVMNTFSRPADIAEATIDLSQYETGGFGFDLVEMRASQRREISTKMICNSGIPSWE